MDCPFWDVVMECLFYKDNFSMSSLRLNMLIRLAELLLQFEIFHFDLRLHILFLTMPYFAC